MVKMEIRVKRTNAQNPASDELYHWKYIKRERVNGKWRYYYDVKEVNSKTLGLGEKGLYEYYKKKDADNTRKVKEAAESYKNAILKTIGSGGSPGAKINREVSRQVLSNTIKKREKSKVRVDRALNKYSKTRLGEVELKTRDSIKNAAENIYNALNNKDQKKTKKYI